MVSKAGFEKIALSFETAEMHVGNSMAVVKVFGKFFTRLRPEDDTIVITVGSRDERDMLLELDPETFTLTDHYRSGPWILARRTKIDAKRLKGMLEKRWQIIAPKKLLRERAAVPVVKPKLRKTSKKT